MNIDDILGKATAEQTREFAIAALSNLDDGDALSVILDHVADDPILSEEVVARLIERGTR